MIKKQETPSKEFTQIKVSKEIIPKLQLIKLKEGLRNYDEVILFLIKESKINLGNFLK